MSKTNQKTRLQRNILIMAYDYPEMTQNEIADYLGCSSSYVSQILRDYDNQRALRSRIEGMNEDLERNPMDFELENPEAPNNDEDEDINLEDLSPFAIVVISIIIGGIFLINNPVPNLLSWYFPWIIVAGSIIAILGIGVIFYTKYQSEGIKEAIRWFFDSFDSTEEDETPPNKPDQTDTTPPVPEKLKNELYFERANQKCEWCGKQVNSPDIHHIKPRNEGGSNDPKNLIVLCPNCHRQADGGVISRSKLKYKIKNK